MSDDLIDRGYRLLGVLCRGLISPVHDVVAASDVLREGLPERMILLDAMTKGQLVQLLHPVVLEVAVAQWSCDEVSHVFVANPGMLCLGQYHLRILCLRPDMAEILAADRSMRCERYNLPKLEEIGGIPYGRRRQSGQDTREQRDSH